MEQVKSCDKKNYRLIDIAWLLFYIIIYSFNCAFDNFQMMSVILIGMISFVVFCWKGWFVVFPGLKQSGCTLWYAPFFIYASIAYFWTSRAARSSVNMVTTLVQILVFCMAIDWYVKEEKDLDLLYLWFSIATFVFATIVLVTSSPSTYGSLDFGKFTGMQRNTTGYVLMFGCVFDVYLFEKRNNRFFLFFAAICLGVSLLTGSRKIIIGYALAIGLWMLLQRDVKKTIKYIGFSLLIIAIVVPVAFQIPYIRETFGERMLAIFDSSIEDGSNQARERARKLAWELFKSNPFIGRGWNAVATNYAAYWERKTSIYAHNNYLELGADFGIIGIFLFYFKFLVSTVSVFINRFKNIDYRFLLICFCMILLLDYGQVTYLYLYMVSIYVLLFKKLQLLNTF